MMYQRTETAENAATLPARDGRVTCIGGGKLHNDGEGVQRCAMK